MKLHAFRKKQEPEKPQTIGDFIDAVSACKTEEQATEMVAKEIEHIMRCRPELLREEARKVVMENVGYVSGYFDRGTAARIRELFGARHPVFGAMEDWPKTPEETIAHGVKMGERLKARQG